MEVYVARIPSLRLGRRALSAETVPWNYRLSSENAEYLLQRANGAVRTYTTVINDELDFARAWGLPALLVRRLDAEALSRGVLTKDLVHSLVFEEALRLPRVFAPPSKHRKYLPKTSLRLSKANHMFLSGIVDAEGVSAMDVLDRVIDFTRTLGLAPDSFAALQSAAERQDCSVRDCVRMVLWEFAAQGRGSWVKRQATTFGDEGSR